MEMGISLDGDQLGRFEIFEANLYKANEITNLTRVPREDCWIRHFLDSLLLVDLIPAGCDLLDIGSGPGFPAWPIACARPDVQVVAIDSAGKMVRFMNDNPLPNFKAVQIRAEEWPMRERFDFVTGRALAPLGIQLELSAPLCKIGGVVVPLRTPADTSQCSADVTMLGLELMAMHERALPVSDAVRLLPVFAKRGPTKKGYPRTWAEMKRKPLI